jgi:hypothetical protein
MVKQWYFQVMGDIVGPLSAAELREKAASGDIDRDTLIRKGEGDWVRAERVRGLFTQVPPRQATKPPEVTIDKTKPVQSKVRSSIEPPPGGDAATLQAPPVALPVHSPGDAESVTECPNGHGPLKEWKGELRCWTCGWTSADPNPKVIVPPGSSAPTKYYERLCLERLAFIPTVAVIAAITAIVNGAGGGGILMAFFLTGFLTFSMYFTANYFLGIGGFVERFPENAVPERARLTFSWVRYLLEIVFFVGVFIAVFLLVGSFMLVNWAVHGNFESPI